MEEQEYVQEESPQQPETHKESSQPTEAPQSKSIKSVGSILSPEGVVMLSAAFIVDAGEFLAEWFIGPGTVISIILDIFAFLFIGLWMIIRSGSVKVPKKTKKRIAKTATKATKWIKRLKWLRPLCFFIEMIPWVGTVLPLWILIVYLELSNNPK